jgi:hypothetical protein
MATTPLSLEQFGQSVKAKHPEYADMSDADVANKVLAKYPQYRDMVQATPTSPQSWVQSVQQAIDRGAQTEPVAGVGSALNDLGAGATRVMLSPIAHPLQTIGSAAQMIGAMIPGSPQMWDVGQKMVAPFVQNPSGEAIAAIPQAAMALAGGGEGAAKAGDLPPVTPNPWAQAAQADQPWLNLASRLTASRAQGAIDQLSESLKAQSSSLSGTGARTPLEFSKAAESLQNNSASPAWHDVVDPIADQPLGSGALMSKSAAAEWEMPSTGKKVGTSPTIGEAEQALREANEIGGPSYTKGANAADTKAIMSANAAAAQLRTALNARISELTGMSSEDVGTLRQNTGQIANIAQNARQRAIQNAYGATSPAASALQGASARTMPARFVRAAITEPIANWQFRQALSAAEKATGEVGPTVNNLSVLNDLLNK